MAQILGNVRVKAKLNLCAINIFPSPVFACSKLTIETITQGVKFLINKDTRTMFLT